MPVYQKVQLRLSSSLAPPVNLMVTCIQVMPCSSGSSEVWFATKVFTGEDVVVKRVLDSDGLAFGRERVVLKVRLHTIHQNLTSNTSSCRYSIGMLRWSHYLLSLNATQRQPEGDFVHSDYSVSDGLWN